MTAQRACSTPGCPNLTRKGRCKTCRTKAEQQRRPNGNPYTSRGHRLGFRATVLARHPHCQCKGECGQPHNGICAEPSTIADHHPLERHELIEQDLNPNDPQHGVGKCKPCHDRKTARTTNGGWRNQT